MKKKKSSWNIIIIHCLAFSYNRIPKCFSKNKITKKKLTTKQSTQLTRENFLNNVRFVHTFEIG